MKHASSLARAAALARVREAIEKVSKEEAMTPVAGTRMLAADETSKAPNTTQRLPTAVTPKKHRSPSWSRIESLKHSETGAGPDNPGSGIDVGDKDTNSHSQGHFGRLHEESPLSLSAINTELHSSRVDGMRHDVPIGGVRAREHRSPSQSLEGGKGPSIASEVAAALASLASTKTATSVNTHAKTSDRIVGETKTRVTIADKDEREIPPRRVTASKEPTVEPSRGGKKALSSPHVTKKSSETAIGAAKSMGKHKKHQTSRGGGRISPRSSLNMLSSDAATREARFDPENVPSARDTHPNIDGSIASLIQNYTPFSARSNRTRILHETEARVTEVAAPASLGPAVGQRRPSTGPANPRAMYGREAPPPPPVHLAPTRRPSSVVLPSPPDDDTASSQRTPTSEWQGSGRNGEISTKTASTRRIDSRGLQLPGVEGNSDCVGFRRREAAGTNSADASSSSSSSSSSLSLARQKVTSAAAGGIGCSRNPEGCDETSKVGHGDEVEGSARRRRCRESKAGEAHTNSTTNTVGHESRESECAGAESNDLGASSRGTMVVGDTNSEKNNGNSMSWEDQLRTMAGVALGRRTRARHIGKKRSPSRNEEQVRCAAVSIFVLYERSESGIV